MITIKRFQRENLLKTQLFSDICLNLTNRSDFSDLRQIHFWQSNKVLIILISLPLLSNVVLIMVPWSVSTNLDQFVFLIKPLAIVPVWRARYGLEPEINISVDNMFINSDLAAHGKWCVKNIIWSHQTKPKHFSIAMTWDTSWKWSIFMRFSFCRELRGAP